MNRLYPRIRLWPKTLLGQTLAATVLAIIVSQALTILVFSQLVLKPELHRVSRIMAQSVAGMSDSLGAASPEVRAVMISRLNKSAYIEIWSGQNPPDNAGSPPRALERVFMQQLVDELGSETKDNGEIYWRTDKHRRLWIHMHIGPDTYWISVKAIPVLAPSGAVLLAALTSAILAFLVAWSVNSKVMRPLRELQSATEHYSLSAEPAPLTESGPSEIAKVSHSFNMMTERLASNDADRTLILAGISHDLRTPLAKLRLALDMMPHSDEELRDSAHRQVQTIDRILSQFMIFARGFDAEPIAELDLDHFMHTLSREYSNLGVVVTNLSGTSQICCRAEALHRAVSNLVENAVRYGRAPIHVDIVRFDDDTLSINVRDHGAGVPQYLLARLIEPFVRGDHARTHSSDATSDLPSGGTGLGLAIVGKIAKAHEGELNFVNLSDGFEAQLKISSVLQG